MMDEEKKYRVEETGESDRDESIKGFLAPLPESKTTRRDRGKRTVPMTKLFGVEMKETTRDWIILVLMPMIAGLIDASIYSLVVVDALLDDTLYLFIIPMIAAIPIGLTIAYASRALLGGILTVLFFAIFMLIFLASPGFFAADLSPFDYMFASGVFLAIYSLFIIFASLLGTLVGIIIREFF